VNVNSFTANTLAETPMPHRRITSVVYAVMLTVTTAAIAAPAPADIQGGAGTTGPTTGPTTRQATGSAPTAQKLKYSRPYCGVYCLYGALHSLGVETPMANLLRPEYISTTDGSSISELVQAARDAGAYATAFDRLPTDALYRSPDRLILHVKSAPDAKKFDHFVLCLGGADDGVRLFDPARGVRTISSRDMGLVWDGTAIVVGRTPVNSRALLLPARLRLFALGACVLCAAVAPGLLKPRVRPRGTNPAAPPTLRRGVTQSLGQVALMWVAAGAVALCYHAARADGLLAHHEAVESTVKAHETDFIPHVDAAAVKSAAAGGAVIIDARLAPDYALGHIDGALSIPVDLGAEERRRALAAVPRASRIIIYCQSPGCPYAGRVAASLRADGFEDLSIYRGGWVEWKTQVPKGAR
jgi:rhodanese-related sulfurtransferase